MEAYGGSERKLPWHGEEVKGKLPHCLSTQYEEVLEINFHSVLILEVIGKHYV
jgi:hypothetical protein